MWRLRRGSNGRPGPGSASRATERPRSGSVDESAAIRSSRGIVRSIQAAAAVRLTQLRFDAGADSLFNLVDAQRTLAATEGQLANSDALVTTYQIALFKALAGGWVNEG